MQARRRYSKLALWVNIKTAVVEENLGLYEIFFSNKGFFSMEMKLHFFQNERWLTY